MCWTIGEHLPSGLPTPGMSFIHGKESSTMCLCGISRNPDCRMKATGNSEPAHFPAYVGRVRTPCTISSEPMSDWSDRRNFLRGHFTPIPYRRGRTAGLLPVEFDPHFDAFWPAPDGQSLLLLKEDRNLFLFPLSGDEAGISLPFLLLPRENTILQLWWQNNGDILLLAGGSRRGDASTRLYRLDSGANLTGNKECFLPVELVGIRRFIPSPDRSLLAVLKETENSAP
jgi:hypothetical protein